MTTTHTLYINNEKLKMYFQFIEEYPKPQASRKILELMEKHLEEKHKEENNMEENPLEEKQLEENNDA